LLDSDKAKACPEGCGEWLPQAYIDELLPKDTLLHLASAWWKHAEAPCPICRRRMDTRSKDWLTYELCAEHGVWLDANQRSRFDAAFAVDITSFRRFRELVSELAKGGEEAAQAMARRIIDLEQRLAKLERERG
jgi:hypothetical protein